jgi:hypothetical protein
MPTAIELHREGRDEELWQMCCGFLSLSISDFMDIQKRLLLEQLELLGNSKLGQKIMHGARPRTVEEFRRTVPLTTYKDYCPELIEKRENTLPAKPEQWARTSGKSGEYPYKWVPLTHEYSLELSKVLYGIGMISCCNAWGDTSKIPDRIRILYSVAPRPYISGTFAQLLMMQTPLKYLPTEEESQNLTFEERIKLGFQQAMYQGIDYFFGLSQVLVSVGDKFSQSSKGIDLRPFLVHPKALWRLGKGILKSRLAGRPLLPRDIWLLKGIIGSGVDSWVYKNKIKEYWGRNLLDLYSSTEGGIMATQTWDYDGMTFIPNLNFFEFIPEEEHFKWQMDHSYQPEVLLLDELKAGENYELVITNFHGGALTRYRIGDMVRITSLRNTNLGIDIPQMVFERRVDDLLNFMVVRLTEKEIWQAIESAGIVYENWTAYKVPGEPILRVLIEPKNNYHVNETDMASALQAQFLKSNDGNKTITGVLDDLADMIDFKVEVVLLPHGTYARYTAQKQAIGSDLAHLKPPHVNPSDEALSLLLGETEEIVVVKTAKTGIESGTQEETKVKKVSVD